MSLSLLVCIQDSSITKGNLEGLGMADEGNDYSLVAILRSEDRQRFFTIRLGDKT